MQEQSTKKEIATTVKTRSSKTKLTWHLWGPKSRMLAKPLGRVNFEENRAWLGLHKKADFEE
jgi:hypothetical protein